MKIVVMNFSGNVGKSTVAKHLLQPRIPNAEMFAIESINADDHENVKKLRGDEFGVLMQKILAAETAIVDVGASNVESFMLAMQDFIGSHEDYDYFVIPTVPDDKQIRDTIATIEALAELGVPAKKIRVVMNKVGRLMKPQTVFADLFTFEQTEKLFILDPGAVMHDHAAYAMLKRTNETVEAIVDDPTDLKAAITEADDEDVKAELALRIAARRLSVGVRAELDAVFTVLID